MPYAQDEATLRVSVPSLEDDKLLLQGFSGTEHVSSPFRFIMRMVSEDDAVDGPALLREPLVTRVALPSGKYRWIHGLVRRFVQLEQSGSLTAYEAEVVPWIWFLSLTQDSRVFQNLDVREIVAEVFGKYSFADFDDRCLGSYPKREFNVQYRESDLNFVSRLLEEEGILYFFEHTEKGHKLVLCDDPGRIKDCVGQPKVHYSPDGWLDEDVVTEMVCEHSTHTDRFTYRDYDYLKPKASLEAKWGDEDTLEVYDYPGLYTEVSEGERLTARAGEERVVYAKVMRGTSTCRALVPGFNVELTSHPADAMNGKYFITSIRHEAQSGGYLAEGGSPASYSNQFEWVLADTTYRPPRRAQKPVVQGSQTALVVGPSGEEIHTDTDGHGRVKIQFPWDRLGGKDENSSCWVRVSQVWAGKGWGGVTIPRIGQEVVVDFLEGDPDRPIIIGRVYNNDNKPPLSPGAGGLISGLKSDTHKGSGFNEFSFDDTAGSELVNLHGQKDMTTTILNDRTESIGNDETVSVGNNRTEDVGVDEKITIGSNRTENVGADETISIGGNRTESVTGNETISISGSHDETISKTMKVMVMLKRDLIVGGMYSQKVGGLKSMQIGGAYSRTIVGMSTETVGAAKKVNVSRNYSDKVNGDRKIEVAGNYSANFKGDHVEFVDKDYVLSTKNMELMAEDKISILCGKAGFVLEKDGTVTLSAKKIQFQGTDFVLKGKKLDIKMSGDVNIKGKNVNLK